MVAEVGAADHDLLANREPEHKHQPEPERRDTDADERETGNAVRLTIDADLQRVAEEAITYGIRIAHDLGVQAQTGLPGEQAVVGVDDGKFGAGLRGLPIRGGSDDQAMNMLEAPRCGFRIRGLEKFVPQPVKEFRVRGRNALRAEIVFGFDEALAEVLLPNAIDCDTRRERVVGRCNGVRQVQPPAAVGERGPLPR